MRRQSPTRRWLPVVAAASATAIAAGAVSAYLHNSRGDVSDPVAASEATELVVDDGDHVRATGMVQITPGQPARFCAPAPTTMAARGSAEEAPSCVHGIAVTGVDAKRLSDPKKYGDVRTGFATMTGSPRSVSGHSS